MTDGDYAPGVKTLTTSSDLWPQLEAAGLEVADARTALDLALARRDQLAVAAVDEGMRQKDVAAAIGVKPPHVIRILGQAGA